MARHKPNDQRRDGRLYLRINSALKREVAAYCARRNLDVSDVVERFLTKLVSLESARQTKESSTGGHQE